MLCISGEITYSDWDFIFERFCLVKCIQNEKVVVRDFNIPLLHF